MDWPLVAEFIAGGLAGDLVGMRLASRLASERGVLSAMFAMVLAVASFMFCRNAFAA